MKALRPWTGCPRSKSGASRSRLPRRRRSGAIIVSTSSIRPGTWTSPSRSSGACACSMARWSSSTAWPASSPSPRRSGARPTATACPASASSTSSTGPVPTSGAASTRSRTASAPTPCPLQIPIGSEDQFKGVIDLVEMKAIYYRDDLGNNIDVVDIPDEFQAEADKHRRTLIEAVAEMDDELTHKYLEGEELTIPEIKRGLRLGTLTTRIIPVLTGSALKQQGRPEDARRGRRLPAVAARRPADDRARREDRRGGPAHARRHGAVQRPRLQDRRRPVRRASSPSSGSTPARSRPART